MSQPADAPITTLIEQARKFKYRLLTASDATQLLGPFIASALAHEESDEVAAVVRHHSWAGDHFTSDVNVHQLIDALQKCRFERLGELGKGAYAVVYKARNRETNEVIAVKKMMLVCGNQGVSPWALREVNALKELKHDNIVDLKDVVFTLGNSYMWLVMECLDCDLRTFILQCREHARAPNIKACMYQILQGIHHAHSNLIMHRDLKPQNILVDVKKGILKIGDFGLSRSFLPSCRAYSDKVVTLWYRAPELLLGASSYTQAVDMWSVGCILAEMVNERPLFIADCEVGLLHSIFQVLGTPSRTEWDSVDELAYFRQDFPRWPKQNLAEVVPRLSDDRMGLHLLSRLLVYEPQLRMTAAEALEHPWFHDITKPNMSTKRRRCSADCSSISCS